MTTSMETRLRQDLRELAEVPGPPSLVDRALADARKRRRLRVVVAGAGTLALVALVAVPFALWRTGVIGSLPLLPGAPAPGECKEATDEASPPDGVPDSEQPTFIRIVQGKLPPRSDYHLQYAHGLCELDQPNAASTGGRYGYAVINIGPNREHGHLTVTIRHEAMPMDCSEIPAPGVPETNNMVCEDATATTPLVLLLNDESQFSLTAVYPGDRVVSMEAIGTPFDADTIKAVVIDPDLVAMLG